ncbi:MAG: sugar ABC transporter permease [Clostridium sp.]|nr:sugar ABC transporter permease [Acetatifactor muris]MCM1527657.1 sugar ABC transporter permease [Bacteroides sp.]MCM1563399.1 sugar ABC transporter permease [Clostridium sp.]
MRSERKRREKRRKHRNLSYLPFLLPSLSGVAVFAVIPFGDVARRSFMTAMTGEFCGLANYRGVLGNQAFLLAMRNTCKFMAVCLPLLLAGSLAIAVAMAGIPFLERFRSCYLLPQAMPAATIVLVWRLVFAKQGFLNGMMGTEIDFMKGNASFLVLVGTYLWKNMGYTVVLWLAALKTVPSDIVEAAKVDGAGKIRCFFLITLPCLKGAAYTISLLSLLNAFKVFREAYLINGAYPAREIYLLQHVFSNWYTKLDFDKMAAGAALTALVLGLGAFLMERRLGIGSAETGKMS